MADHFKATERQKAAVQGVLDETRRQGRDVLTAPEGRVIAEAYGIPVPAEGVAVSAEDAVALAGRIGFPVALKIVSPDLPHKTEAGGVRTGLASAAEVRGAPARTPVRWRAMTRSTTTSCGRWG
ncbi:acetate--CoA ligase family protein [Streptomyces sp. S186]|uniref:acetate--CoA ligase family protein n=1 Tax=Streptomyces sp. S186 TaxID=3434395 RepID=UPI003F66A99C